MAQINYKDLEGNLIILFIAPSDKIQDINLEIINHFVNKKDAYCIYVTVAKPAKTIQNVLKKNNVNTDKMFFVDCITSSVMGSEMGRVGNCVFCNPQSLTNISIVLTTALNSLPKDQKRIFILDTVSTLLLYNEATTVSRFMHSLASKLREYGVLSFVLTLEEETDKKIIAQLTQFCDKVIKVS